MFWQLWIHLVWIAWKMSRLIDDLLFLMDDGILCRNSLTVHYTRTLKDCFMNQMIISNWAGSGKEDNFRCCNYCCTTLSKLKTQDRPTKALRQNSLWSKAVEAWVYYTEGWKLAYDETFCPPTSMVKPKLGFSCLKSGPPSCIYQDHHSQVKLARPLVKSGRLQMGKPL